MTHLNRAEVVMEKIVDELQSLGAEITWCKENKARLKECKCYLKTEYPVHCRDGQPSTCADHCRNFALSDNSDEAFKAQCDHAHDTVCEKCEALQCTARNRKAIKKYIDCFLQQRSPRGYALRFCKGQIELP